MFNLLPENLKKIVRSEYLFRFLVTATVCLIILELCFMVVLAPSWFLVFYKEKALENNIEEMKRLEGLKNVETFSSNIKLLNSQLHILDTRLDYSPLSSTLETVLSNKRANIHLISFNYSVSGPATTTIAIAGISDTRESLVSFVKRLENSGKFIKVDLPVSNLAKEKDINFSVNLSMASSTQKK